jgi:peptidoglycan/LPS O-acetylase OafA/YrhL
MHQVRESALRERSLKYRSDIDGLRAIAVSGVVLYHLQSVDILPGGFLGVDVFFVISGFLITSLILPSIQNGTFSFKGFYLRRARRLLPAFVVVALATVTVSWFVLDPARMLNFTDSLFFAIFGLSNMYFMFQDPYWADSASTLPFLHTWSLGVEEQFYLVFPALLLIATKFLGKHSRVALFSLLGLLSLLLAYWVSGLNPTYAFYLFPTRAWELLVGVVLALILGHWKILVPRVIASLSVSLGLLLIGVSYFYLGQFITAPGLLTIVPVLGAALIIFGGLTSNPVSRGLGIRPLAGLGLISYSLYLWHYPILALGGVRVPWGPGGEVVALALASILAIVTYFLIETPFRQGKRARPFIAFSSVGTITLLAVVSGAATTSGFEDRAGGGVVPWPERPNVYSEFGVATRAENSKGQILIFGDSHMARLRLSLSEQASVFGLDFIDGTGPACPFFVGITNLGKVRCTADFQAERLALSASVPPSFVILGGRFPLSIDGTRFDNTEGGVEPGDAAVYSLPGVTDPDRENQKTLVQDSLKLTIESLLEQGHTVVLVYPIPEVGWHVPTEIGVRALVGSGFIQNLEIPETIKAAISRRVLPGLTLWPFEADEEATWPLQVPVTTLYDVYADRTQSTFDALDSISNERIIRIYPHKIFCDDREGGRCLTHDNNNIFYLDRHHLSTSGARLLSAEIMVKIRESSNLSLPRASR